MGRVLEAAVGRQGMPATAEQGLMVLTSQGTSGKVAGAGADQVITVLEEVEVEVSGYWGKGLQVPGAAVAVTRGMAVLVAQTAPIRLQEIMAVPVLPTHREETGHVAPCVLFGARVALFLQLIQEMSKNVD